MRPRMSCISPRHTQRTLRPLIHSLESPHDLYNIIRSSPACRSRMNASETPLEGPSDGRSDASLDDDAEREKSDSKSSTTSDFKELGVNEVLLISRLRDMGIREPTDVQRAAIPTILAGNNSAVQCYTGSGKTLAYLLPLLTMCIERSRAEWAGVTRRTAGQAGTVQAVVVAPSRELAMQIVRVAQSVLPADAHRAVQQCIGGANMSRQREALKMYKPFMVVGTPGRLAELSRDGSLQTHRTGILVLDEVDQLLAPQFREAMVRIHEHVGKKFDHGKRQTIIVSATLTPKVLSLCETWCPTPKRIFVGSAGNPRDDDGLDGWAGLLSSQESDVLDHEQSIKKRENPGWGWGAPGMSYRPETDASTRGSAGGFGHDDNDSEVVSLAPGLKHFYMVSPGQHKVDSLRRAIHASKSSRAIVFMNFQHRLKEAAAKLSTRGMTVGYLHGEMSKHERKSVLNAFQRGDFRALIVSDVAARGLDVPECDAVFNLELPNDASHYAHRAGRTARAGREGTVVSIVTPGERFVVDKLSRKIRTVIAEVTARHGTFVDASGAKEGEPLDPGKSS